MTQMPSAFPTCFQQQLLDKSATTITGGLPVLVTSVTQRVGDDFAYSLSFCRAANLQIHSSGESMLGERMCNACSKHACKQVRDG